MLAGRWRKMNTHRKRVFAAALAVAVASTSFNIASLAVSADSSKEGRVITSFEPLENEVAYQYLPVGSPESDIVFPEELKVRVFSSTEILPEEPAPEPENPEPENPEPENPEPETPEEPEPVSDNEGGEEEPGVGEEGDLSAAIKNVFGMKTVYAAEGGEEGGQPEDGQDPENGEPVPEEPAPADPAPAPEEPAPSDPAPEEPAPSDPAPAPEEPAPADPEPSEPVVEEPGTPEPGTDEGGISDNTPSPSPEDEYTEPETPEEEKKPEVVETEEEKTLSDVRWKLVRDESTYSSFEALLEGDVFVYEPDLSRYPLTVEATLPQIRVTITAKEETVSENETVSEDSVSENAVYPEFSRVMICGGIRIKVEAPEGVFPEGAELSVKKIDDAASTEKIKETVGTDSQVAAFDITVKDQDGNEIQPDTENGNVRVTFENVNIIKEKGSTEGTGVSVYHFEDGLKNGEKLDAAVNASAGSASVEAGHFSPFVLVVEGGEEEAAGEVTSQNFIDHALKNGWIKINGYNSGTEAVPNIPIYSYISENMVENVFGTGRYKLWYVIDNSSYSSRTDALTNGKYIFTGKDSTVFNLGFKLQDTTKPNYYYASEKNLAPIYPKYAAYDYTVSMPELATKQRDYNSASQKAGLNPETTVSVKLYWDTAKSNVSANVIEGYPDYLENVTDKEYNYYKVNGVNKDADGDYVLPAGQAIKDGNFVVTDDLKDAGIYAITPKAAIRLGSIASGATNNLKALKNTVSSAAGGLDEKFKLSQSPEQGVYYQIKKISIDRADVKAKIHVTTGTKYYEKEGYEIFYVDSGDYAPLPALTDPTENVKYMIYDEKGNVVKSGVVSEAPARIMDPGKYTVSFDATQAKNYKGTLSYNSVLTIVKRDLSSASANMTVSPDKVVIPKGAAIDPVKPPVKVTWTNGKGIKELLTEGVDYELTYTNNTKTGTATASVNGIGIYTGSKIKNFDIVAGTDMPVVRYRGEDENEPTDKPREWYNVGVRFSGKPKGDITYEAKVDGQSDYARESDAFKKEGEPVEVNLFLKSNNGEVYNLPQKLNIDLTVPTADITVDGVKYSGLNNNGTIAHYTNRAIKASAAGSDMLSQVKGMDYYITDSSTVKTLANLQNMDDGEWTGFSDGNNLPVVENKKSFIYLRVKDNAGNAGFASAKGICYDTIAPTLSKVQSSVVNGSTSLTYTASDALSGVGKYYALVRPSSAAEPTKEEVLKGKVSDNQPFDIGKVSGVQAIYCVVVDRAGNISDVRRVSIGTDVKSPTGIIKVIDKTWDSVQSERKIVAYTREKQLISITGSDPESGVKKIEYYVTNKSYTTASSIASISSNLWKTYSDAQKPEIEHDVLNYVYAKITDGSGNVGFVSTEGIWHDTIEPKLNKISDPKVSNNAVSVTITGSDDESGVGAYFAIVKKADQEEPDAKTVEGSGTGSEKKVVEVKGLVASNSYKVYCVVRDKAGNLSEVKSQAFATPKAADGSGGAGGKGSKGSSKSGSGSSKTTSKDKQKAAADAYRKQAGITGDQAGSGSVLDSVAMPTRIPYINEATAGIEKGEELTSGWSRITSESVKAPEPSEIHILMNGETVVPTALLKSIAKKNITVYFQMTDDYIWAVNGLSFTADPKENIDLRVRKDTKNIPSDMVNDAADVYPHTTLSLEHNGDFGCKAILSIPFGSENTGMYANLYYFNEGLNRLDFMDSAQVQDNGRSEFEFTHASDYLVVLRGDALTEKTALGTEDLGIISPETDDNVIKPKSFFSLYNKNLWILIVTILSLTLCLIVLFVPDSKKKKAAA